MSTMKVKDFDSYRAPKRRPWGALVIVLLVGLLVYWFGFRDAPEKPPAQSEAVAVTTERSDGATTETPASDDAGAAAAKPTADVALIMEEAAQLAADDKLVAARDKYWLTLKHVTDVGVRRTIEKALGTINIELIMTHREMPEKENYLVQSGDSLEKIARKFDTTVQLLQKSNMLMDPNIIKAGDRLRVFTGAFSITASKSQHDLVVMMNGQFFKRYKVGTGRYGKTPEGSFELREKIAQPVWWRPDGREVPYGDAENILGTRWMSLRATGATDDVRGYGIHGTWKPESVGIASSAGCLRMVNKEVEELFIYIPVGTPVTIEE